MILAGNKDINHHDFYFFNKSFSFSKVLTKHCQMVGCDNCSTYFKRAFLEILDYIFLRSETYLLPHELFSRSVTSIAQVEFFLPCKLNHNGF